MFGGRVRVVKVTRAAVAVAQQAYSVVRAGCQRSLAAIITLTFSIKLTARILFENS